MSLCMNCFPWKYSSLFNYTLFYEASYHLLGDDQAGLEGELCAAEVEEVLEGGAEQLHDHDVVLALLAGPVEHRRPFLSLQQPQNLRLV